MAAIAMSILVAGQSAAATWSPPLKLSTTMGFADGLAMAGTTAVALYRDGESSYARRSLDGGISWQPRVWLTSNAPGGAYNHVLAAYDHFVDVVYEREGRIRYRRSVDSGASFGSAVSLSAKGVDVGSPVVAHGPGGIVIIAWGNAGSVGARISLNDGASFGTAKTIATAELDLSEPLAVAVGSGVIYVGYYTEWNRLRLKRSLDGGATWSSATNVSNSADGESGLDIAASGTHAYIAYATSDVHFFAVDYRRTVDSGGTWSPVWDLSPPGTDPAFAPHLFLRGGVLRAVYTTCVDNWDYCDPYTGWYTQSSNGLTWTSRQRTMPTSYEENEPVGVGSAGRPIVLVSSWRESDGWGAWVRRRS